MTYIAEQPVTKHLWDNENIFGLKKLKYSFFHFLGHSEEPIKSASTSLKDFRSNVNDLLQVEEIELSPPKKARYNTKSPHLTVYEKSLEFQRKNNAATYKQLQDYGNVSIDEDFSPIGKTRSATKKTTSTPKSHSKTSTPKSQPKIVVVPFEDHGQRNEQNTVS